jgi:WD40 repeat protein
VAIATDGPTVLVCDLADDLLVAKLRFGGNSPIRSLCTLRIPSGLLLAAGTAQRTRLWNTQTWQVTRTMTISGVKALNPLPQGDGTDLLVSGDGHSVRVWNPQSGAPLHTLITAAPVQALAHSGRPKGLLAFGGPQGFAVVDFSTAL